MRQGEGCRLTSAGCTDVPFVVSIQVLNLVRLEPVNFSQNITFGFINLLVCFLQHLTSTLLSSIPFLLLIQF